MVAAGKSADFVVLDANPLDDITNTRRISRVFLRGVEIDRATLKAGFMAGGRRTESPSRVARRLPCRAMRGCHGTDRSAWPE